MAREIWKFLIRITDEDTVRMPQGAKILCAQIQRDSLQLWALVDTEAILDWRRFCIIGTGHSIPPAINLKYISTFQLGGGDFVAHLFEIEQESANAKP